MLQTAYGVYRKKVVLINVSQPVGSASAVSSGWMMYKRSDRREYREEVS